MISIEIVATVGSNSYPVNVTAYGPGTYTVTVSGAGAYGTVPVVVNRTGK